MKRLTVSILLVITFIASCALWESPKKQSETENDQKQVTNILVGLDGIRPDIAKALQQSKQLEKKKLNLVVVDAASLGIAAIQTSKRVLALGDKNTADANEQPKATWSLNSPNAAYLGESKFIDIQTNSLKKSEGWIDEVGDDITSAKESTFDLLLNNDTQESRTIEVLVRLFEEDVTEIIFDTDKDLKNGFLGRISLTDKGKIANLFFFESNPTSKTQGAKRRVFAYLLPESNSKQLKFYISKSTYNNAYPEEFRRHLDDSNLVWPDYGYDLGSLKVSQKWEGQALIERFLTDVAIKTLDQEHFDIVLLKQKNSREQSQVTPSM